MSIINARTVEQSDARNQVARREQQVVKCLDRKVRH